MTAARTNALLGWKWITDTDTGDTRAVVGDCVRCAGTPGRSYVARVVSPSGLVHCAPSEETICGQDATRDGWLWPE